MQYGMLHPFKSRALLLLIALAVFGAAEAFACGLDHCPRPKAGPKDRASLGWSLEHVDLGSRAPDSRYTQGAFHLRLPFGDGWRLGGHLPFGYLRTADIGHWGMGNPMVYGEKSLAWTRAGRGFEDGRPSFRQSLSLGLQVELPLGDDADGIASGHAMAMPYLTYTLQGSRLRTQVSAGFSAQIPDGHSHGHEAEAEGAHAGHAGHDHVVASALQPALPAIEVNPHDPYELLYKAALSLPLAAGRLIPEAGVYGQRVLFSDRDSSLDFITAEAALGIRAAGDLVFKPRLRRQLLSPGRFDWSLGMDFQYELAANRRDMPR
jgi:hypothetical protein